MVEAVVHDEEGDECQDVQARHEARLDPQRLFLQHQYSPCVSGAFDDEHEQDGDDHQVPDSVEQAEHINCRNEYGIQPESHEACEDGSCAQQQKCHVEFHEPGQHHIDIRRQSHAQGCVGGEQGVGPVGICEFLDGGPQQGNAGGGKEYGET